MDRAVVIHPNFPPGRRIVAVSDIHGNLPFFRALLDKIALTPEDILVLVGDLLEKGQESLTLLRYVMDLCRTHTVYPLCGNCDGLVYRFFQGDELDRRFFSFYLPQHPESTLRQLAREGGFDQTDDLPRLRADLRSAYPEEWRFLSRMPTILETEHLVFVHGGVPSLEHMEQLERWRCMKNDDFLGQGHPPPPPPRRGRSAGYVPCAAISTRGRPCPPTSSAPSASTPPAILNRWRTERKFPRTASAARGKFCPE